MRHMLCGTCCAARGVRHVVCGTWCAARGVRHVVCGTWFAAHGTFHHREIKLIIVEMGVCWRQ